jgi:hypothetical protein
MVMQVGHIDYTKDTYKVLKSSVAGPLNESLQNVINSGALLLIRDENEGLSCRMKKNGDDPQLTIISFLPIQVFVTGDPAYFRAILGKVNMAGDWCTWCGLSAKEWSPADHDKGKLWTLEAMAEARESISLGAINDTLAGRQGCVVDEPL